MKEFKIAIETLECVTINAETAEAALEQVKKNIDPRILAGYTKITVLEEEPETDTSATQ